MAENLLTPSHRLVVIGGSMGSIDALMKLLPNLKVSVPFALVIVLHRKSSVDSTLADLFATRTRIPIREVEDKDTLEKGNIYIAPADYHLLIEQEMIFALDASEKVNYSRPSLDVTFESAADTFGPATVGVLLSGANADGTAGLTAIKKAGGLTIAQHPETAQAPFMPQHAITHTIIDYIFSMDELAAYLNSLG